MDTEGDIADQLDEHATEPESDQRAERRVLGHPDDDLVALADELLHQGTFGVVHHGHHLIEGSSHLFVSLDVEDDPADIGLVESTRGNHLQHHGVSDLLGSLDRPFAGGGHPRCRLIDPKGPQNGFCLVWLQPTAI